MRSIQCCSKSIAPNLRLVPMFFPLDITSPAGMRTERTSQGVNCSRHHWGGTSATIMARKQQGMTTGSERNDDRSHTHVDACTLAAAAAVTVAVDAAGILLMLMHCCRCCWSCVGYVDGYDGDSDGDEGDHVDREVVSRLLPLPIMLQHFGE